MPEVTHNQRMLTTLNGVATDYISTWTQSFFSGETERTLIPAQPLPADLGHYAKADENPFVPQTEVGQPDGCCILMDTGCIPDTLSREASINYLAASRHVHGP